MRESTIAFMYSRHSSSMLKPGTTIGIELKDSKDIPRYIIIKLNE